MIERLSKLPLAYQPGTKWVYSLSVDVQGYLVEKLSGKSLPEFMRERIFEPLGMKDTGFFVPQDKLPRARHRVCGAMQGGGSSPEPHVRRRQQIAGLALGWRRVVLDGG